MSDELVGVDAGGIVGGALEWVGVGLPQGRRVGVKRLDMSVADGVVVVQVVGWQQVQVQRRE